MIKIVLSLINYFLIHLKKNMKCCSNKTCSEKGFVELVALCIIGGVIAAPFIPYIAYSPVFAGRAIYHEISGSWKLTRTEYNMSFLTDIWEGSPDDFKRPPYDDYLLFYEAGYISLENSCNISESGTDVYFTHTNRIAREKKLLEKYIRSCKTGINSKICYSTEYVSPPDINNDIQYENNRPGYIFLKQFDNSFPGPIERHNTDRLVIREISNYDIKESIQYKFDSKKEKVINTEKQWPTMKKNYLLQKALYYLYSKNPKRCLQSCINIISFETVESDDIDILNFLFYKLSASSYEKLQCEINEYYQDFIDLLKGIDTENRFLPEFYLHYAMFLVNNKNIKPESEIYNNLKKGLVFKADISKYHYAAVILLKLFK